MNACCSHQQYSYQIIEQQLHKNLLESYTDIFENSKEVSLLHFDEVTAGTWILL